MSVNIPSNFEELVGVAAFNAFSTILLENFTIQRVKPITEKWRFEENQERMLFFSGFFYELLRKRSDYFSSFATAKGAYARGISSARYFLVRYTVGKRKLDPKYINLSIEE